MWYAWIEAQRRFARALHQYDGMPPYSAFDTQRYPTPPRAADCGDFLCMPWIAPAAPPFGIAAVTSAGRCVAVNEEVVDCTPFCMLRKFTRAADAAAARNCSARPLPAVFLCAPLAGHHAVMLREAVETLLQRHDVYVTDWIDARDVPLEAGPFGLDDYVLTLERFLRDAEPDVHLLAVCQAAVPTLAATSLLARDGAAGPLSITLLGSPIDTRKHPTLVGRFASSHDLEWFRRVAIDVVPPPHAGAGRRVYPGFVQQAALVAAHPFRYLTLAACYWASWLSGSAAAVVRSRRELNEYAAMLDMTERYFLDAVRVIFHDRLLARGAWRVGTRRVAPEALTACALCTVEGEYDDIVGAGQTHAAQTLCSAVAADRRLRLTIACCDHYDLFVGRRWRQEIHPALERFWLASA